MTKLTPRERAAVTRTLRFSRIYNTKRDAQRQLRLEIWSAHSKLDKLRIPRFDENNERLTLVERIGLLGVKLAQAQARRRKAK